MSYLTQANRCNRNGTHITVSQHEPSNREDDKKHKPQWSPLQFMLSTIW